MASACPPVFTSSKDRGRRDVLLLPVLFPTQAAFWDRPQSSQVCPSPTSYSEGLSFLCLSDQQPSTWPPLTGWGRHFWAPAEDTRKWCSHLCLGRSAGRLEVSLFYNKHWLLNLGIFFPIRCCQCVMIYLLCLIAVNVPRGLAIRQVLKVLMQ